LRGNRLARFWWKHVNLTDEITRAVDVLLVPGGSYLGSFRPFVAMAQNLLPFAPSERAHMNSKRLRLYLLEWIQSRTFRQADGVIFMTAISRSQIECRLGGPLRSSSVVYHGCAPRFFRTPKPQRPPSEYSLERPYRLLYLSILEPYKHQDMVVAAMDKLHR